MKHRMTKPSDMTQQKIKYENNDLANFDFIKK